MIGRQSRSINLVMRVDNIGGQAFLAPVETLVPRFSLRVLSEQRRLANSMFLRLALLMLTIVYAIQCHLSSCWSWKIPHWSWWLFVHLAETAH